MNRPIVEKQFPRVNNHPAAVRPAPANDDYIKSKIKPQSLWRQVAGEIGRGAQKALKGAGFAALGVGAATLSMIAVAAVAPGTVSDMADSLKSLLPDFSASPENYGLAATMAGATALFLASGVRKKTVADAKRNFPRAASVACQIAGAVLPLVAGYAVYQGAQQYDAWAARPDPAIMAPQAKAATNATNSLTPR